MLCFALFAWYPSIRGVVMSFQRTRRGETTWVGWDNYARIIDDPSFWTAWKNTLYFTAGGVTFALEGTSGSVRVAVDDDPVGDSPR